MVYVILKETGCPEDSPFFRETELFKQCQAAGIIPNSENDLKKNSLPEPAVSGEVKPDFPCLPLDIRISGMWCPACAWVIETALSNMAGVHQSVCSFFTDRLHCTYNPVQTSCDHIILGIEKLGYTGAIIGHESHSQDQTGAWVRFGTSAFLTLNIMMLSIALYSGFFTQLTVVDIRRLGWPVFFMTTAVLFYGGGQIFKKAWSGFVFKSPGMESLISLGAGSAYIYSTINLWQDSFHVYFDTASMLVTLVLLGKLVETRFKESVMMNLENFYALMPQKVRRCCADFPQGRYETLDRLVCGDVFVLSEGETAAADGVVLSGTAEIDGSSLTGEAIPVSRQAGDTILSGSRICTGQLSVKATAVGDDSTLGQMISIIENALNQKTPVENKSEQMLGKFIPVIVFVAITTGFGWFIAGKSASESLIRAITVLVISCPCALGIASPLMRVAGISLAGKKGILIRKFSAFEQADRVSTIVFDKTGTLTAGRWSLTDVICQPGYEEDLVLAYAAAIEHDSQHVIALEIKKRAFQRNLDIPVADHIIDHEYGCEGRIDRMRIKIGSPDRVAAECGKVPHPFQTESGDGIAIVSRVFMSIGDQLAAIFVFGDQIRPSTTGALEALRQMGKQLVMLSGDEPHAARTVADQLGISVFQGRLLPQGKADYIRHLCQNGECVAMVGDGINDAPALASSDLAVSIPSGYPLVNESADITLMRQDPAQLVAFLHLARQVNRRIAQNLWWAFIYNLVSIPVAMSGLLNPLLAASAMLLSSLSVVGNVLLFIRREHRNEDATYRHSEK